MAYTPSVGSVFTSSASSALCSSPFTGSALPIQIGSIKWSRLGW